MRLPLALVLLLLHITIGLFAMPGFARRVKKKIQKKKQIVFQMDDQNKALCYAYRNPPPGKEKLKLWEIQLVVRNTNGGQVSEQAISDAANNFHDEREKRGRKVGWKKTTKAEDKIVMQAFHKLRPPGCGVDSREVHKVLPLGLKKKIVRRIIRQRLAAKGYTPQEKLEKSDVSTVLAR